MKIRGKALILVILVIAVVAIHLYSKNSARVENQYSNGIFPPVSYALRSVSSLFPFSLGDVLYGMAVVWLIFKIIRFFQNSNYRREKVLKSVVLLFTVIITFNLFWGINYNRVGIASQLGISPGKYSAEELKAINGELVQLVNTSRASLPQNKTHYPAKKEILAGVENCFRNVSYKYPFLELKKHSLKPSLWSRLGDYVGFTGYYNPFTAEAQVNINIPSFLLPFTACHEVAHQLGYAKEMEANFVGYLAASSSENKFFHYSMYFDLFLYANRTLYSVDSISANSFRERLSLPVQADLEELRQYHRKYSSRLSPYIWWAYGRFLKSNKQPQGLRSYDEVTSFLIAYKKKFGKI